MIWRSVIFFSLTTGLAWAATASGRVTLEDPAARQKDNSGVVVWLEPVSGKAELKPAGATMVHKSKTFLPHILPVVVGTKVAFPNRDPFFHNAFSNYDGQIFDIGLHAPGTTRYFTFGRPGVVRVFCNIHATMSAIIAVLNTPWYAVTGSNGKYTFNGVPPGEYNLHMFHERALPDNLKYLERRITVPDAGLVMPLISITETGFIPADHLNKYGKDYPPVSNDSAYPGAPKK